jgi:DNA ligase (NAD+)
MLYDNAYDDWFYKSITEKHGSYTWTTNDNGENVDIILDNFTFNDMVIVKRLVDFFTAIGAPHLKQGNIQKLFKSGLNTHEDIIKASESELVSVLGENGSKVYVGLRKMLTNIPVYKLFGAYSNERGLGVRKLKKLEQAWGGERLLVGDFTPTSILQVEGFQAKSAIKVVDSYNLFSKFVKEVDNYVTFDYNTLVVSTTGVLSGKKVVMTGFRDKELAAAIESKGGENQSTTSSKTSILVSKTPNSNSGKVKKARDLGITIMGIEEFKQFIGI